MTVERRVVGALFPPPDYAHVGIGGRLVFTAGAVPLDASGELVGAGDYAAQTAQTIENLLTALAAGGASPEDVVKTTVFVVARGNEALGEVWEVVRQSTLAGAPSTLLGVTALGYSGQLVEIEAIAVIS